MLGFVQQANASAKHDLVSIWNAHETYKTDWFENTVKKSNLNIS